MHVAERERLRLRRHRRVRGKVVGSTERPRLNVSRTLKHIYVQVIDDSRGHTLVAASSVDADLKKSLKTGGDIKAAVEVGKLIATRCKENGIEAVVFDRGGYKYHGRIQALADAAREGGLNF